jgi:hypothetical protein
MTADYSHPVRPPARAASHRRATTIAIPDDLVAAITCSLGSASKPLTP